MNNFLEVFFNLLKSDNIPFIDLSNFDFENIDDESRIIELIKVYKLFPFTKKNKLYSHYELLCTTIMKKYLKQYQFIRSSEKIICSTNPFFTKSNVDSIIHPDLSDVFENYKKFNKIKELYNDYKSSK